MRGDSRAISRPAVGSAASRTRRYRALASELNGLANATIQQRLVAVRLFYDYLVEEGLARAIPSIDFLASRLPNCKLIGWADAGHLRVAKHWHEILATVA